MCGQGNLWRQGPKKISNFVPKNKKTVTSADNQLTFPKTPTAGKKPHQVKRKRTERTVTSKKLKM
jgi:hypothetical protein